MSNIKYILVIIISTIILLSCSDSNTDPKDFSLEELYKMAVNDATVVDDDEVSENLIAISDTNRYIQKKNVDGKNYILGLVLTKYRDSYPIGDTILTYWGETWITIVPEMKDYFKKFKFVNDSVTQLRVQQLLGIPPNPNPQYIVEIWIDSDSLFRPSPDNEINDTRAELHFPVNTPESYITWFNNYIIHSYFPTARNAYKYPWTRLGYTYNWALGANEQGLSEFVLKKNSKAIVKFVGSPSEYLY